MKWYYISTKKATFLIGANNGLVVETAPIAHKSKMRKIEDVLSFYRNIFGAYIKYLGED